MKNFHLHLRKMRHEEIAAYAKEMGGTEFDLDRDLEVAGIERSGYFLPKCFEMSRLR